MDTLSIGLLGCGTVGSGVVRVLRDNAEEIEQRLGTRLRVEKIAVLDPAKMRNVAIDPELLTSDAGEVVDDPRIAIVVELIGGVTTAAELVLRAVANKKHIVTANKTLLARRGPDVFSAASASGVDVFYEGAVCGGIPIIRALRESLASERITSIAGIVNGTTNFILSAMAGSGAQFAAMLAEAQRLGYAEADPSADIDGHDAAQKLAILASLGFSARVTEEDVYVEGIRDVTAEDIAAAARHGYAIKPLAVAERIGPGRGEPVGWAGDRIALRVHPAWVSRESMLAHVDGVFNAVLLESEALGCSMFYGRGAGQLPTGSAVVADVIDMARNIKIGAAGRLPHLATKDSHLRAASVAGVGETRSAFYLRFSLADVPGVLGRIATCLGEHRVSLRVVHQEVQGDAEGSTVPVIALTHPTREKDVRAAVAAIDRLDTTRAGTRWMRIYGAE